MYIGTPPPDYITALPPYVVPQSVLIACMMAYLVASFPNGFLFVTMGWIKPDLKATGPRNIEAEEIWRLGKKPLAVLTWLMDLTKGPFSMMAGIAFGALFLKHELSALGLTLGRDICIPELSVYTVFLPPIAALLGEVFPIWLNFRGGKGMPAVFGLYLMLNPVVGVITIALWLAVFARWRRAAVASVASVALSPLWAVVFRRYVWLEWPDVSLHFAGTALAFVAVILWTHRKEIVTRAA